MAYSPQKLLAEALAVEDVVAQDEADRVVTNERFADQERLGQTVWRRLFGIAEVEAELMTITEQLAVLGQVLRGGDKQNVTDTGQHQHRDRVVDHRLVVDRQQLLGDAESDGVQAGAGAARQDDTFGHAIRSFESEWAKGTPR